MGNIHRNTEYVDWLGELRPLYGNVVEATSLAPPTPTPTPSTTAPITPTPTNTPTNTTTPTNTPTNTTTPTNTPTPSPPPFDSDAAAYLAEVLAQGGTLNATISGATNTMFTDLKLEGLYNKLFCLYPLIGETADSHAINAVNLTAFTIGWTAGITHDSLGSKGNGTSAYGNSNWVQNSETTASNTSLGFYMSVSGNNAYDMGRQVSGGYLSINNYQSATNFRVAVNSGLANLETNMSGETGFYALSRNNSTEVHRYVPSNPGVTTSSSETAALATSSCLLMATGGIASYSSKTYGTFFIGEGLSLSELQNLASIIITFNNTIGR